MALKLNWIDIQQAAGHIDILQPIELSFVVPAGGELYLPSDTVPVTWTIDNPDVQYIDPNNIRIDLDRNNEGTWAETVVASVDADDLSTSFLATPTFGLALDTQASLRLVDLQTSNVIATSSMFTLKRGAIRINFKGTYTVAS